jgi:type IV secretory pathway VirB6-like protein
MNMNRINYRSLFILGTTLFPTGLITGIFPLWALGFALVLIPLANCGKWEQG